MMCPVIILDQNIVIELKKKECTQQAIPQYGTTHQKNVHFLKTL